MAKEKIFNHHKYQRALATSTKSAAMKRAKELKKSVGKNYISVRVVKAAKKDKNTNWLAGYEVYFRTKTPKST